MKEKKKSICLRQDLGKAAALPSWGVPGAVRGAAAAATAPLARNKFGFCRVYF